MITRWRFVVDGCHCRPTFVVPPEPLNGCGCCKRFVDGIWSGYAKVAGRFNNGMASASTVPRRNRNPVLTGMITARQRLGRVGVGGGGGAAGVHVFLAEVLPSRTPNGKVGKNAEMVRQVAVLMDVADDAEGVGGQVLAKRDVVDGSPPL